MKRMCEEKWAKIYSRMIWVCMVLFGIIECLTEFESLRANPFMLICMDVARYVLYPLVLVGLVGYLILNIIYTKREVKAFCKRMNFSEHLEDENLTFEMIDDGKIHFAQDGIHIHENGKIVPYDCAEIEAKVSKKGLAWLAVTLYQNADKQEKYDYREEFDWDDDYWASCELNGKTYAVIKKFDIQVKNLEETVEKVKACVAKKMRRRNLF